MPPNMTDFMCFPQVPIHVASFGSLITLNPEFTTVFRTTTGVIEDCVKHKRTKLNEE